MTAVAPSRLDVWLVDHGMAESREKAQALVMAGRVRVAGVSALKPGMPVREEAVVEVIPGPASVGRGGQKLIGALDIFSVDPAERIAIDIGASTGGFTEVLLTRGALRVYAVDAGRGQIHESLRGHPRVVVLERVNARYLSTREVPEPCRIGTVDVSFISVLKILPALRAILAPEADLITLVKPQFEVGRLHVGRGGIVKDPALHLQALRDVAWAAAHEQSYAVLAACASPLTGAEGNREFFLHLRPTGPGLDREALEAATARAVESGA